MSGEGVNLIEFLRARLDDTEKFAAKLLRYAQENDLAVKEPQLLGRRIPGWHEWPEVEKLARLVLAEVDAKRRIVALHGPRGQSRSLSAPYCRGCNTEWSEECEETVESCPTMRLLALPYADCPDYCPCWRPA